MPIDRVPGCTTGALPIIGRHYAVTHRSKSRTTMPLFCASEKLLHVVTLQFARSAPRNGKLNRRENGTNGPRRTTRPDCRTVRRSVAFHFYACEKSLPPLAPGQRTGGFRRTLSPCAPVTCCPRPRLTGNRPNVPRTNVVRARDRNKTSDARPRRAGPIASCPCRVVVHRIAVWRLCATHRVESYARPAVRVSNKKRTQNVTTRCARAATEKCYGQDENGIRVTLKTR